MAFKLTKIEPNLFAIVQLKKQSNMQIKNLLMLGGLMIGGLNVMAQEGTNAAGGDASSGEGSVSYSIGQSFGASVATSDGSITEGVQQPYQIRVVTDLSSTLNESSDVNAYPNPVLSSFTVNVDGELNHQLTGVLFNQMGVEVHRFELAGSQTNVNLENFEAGMYMLHVKKDNQVFKNIKIIKN